MERLARVTLAAPADALEAVGAFYGSTVGLPEVGPCAFAAGPDVLAFEPSDGEPFYHFALLVGDLDAARARVDGLVRLLSPSWQDDVVVPFPDWEARAIYFHDPVGNIVELIQHGPAGPDAVLGISEIGAVAADPAAAVREWEARGAPLWDGGIDASGRGLAFCGRKGHTVIVAPVGRGWLPTGRPAEPHPVAVELA